MKISGTYSYAVDNFLDAAYRTLSRGIPIDPPEPVRVWTWNGETTKRPTPDEYNPEHIYYFYFTSDGTSEEFLFEDGFYSDNSGALQIR